ncbi:MAG: alpha-D-ribose 1-methylphosphonate 5-triphosphate diphosphatase, partial [Mangrovicoccus sp.]|nr:alpha-D-ribose 1-methylphosphonate 5-triphosphate diphosphatase [Mangrovicoccus sp.]
MPAELILANAALVLPDRIALGNLCLREGRIVAVGSGSAVPRGAIDCDGDVLAPGLVELHTDNLERHLTPRPKVDWPHRAAILAHDGELASTGITTVFDAIRVGSIPSVPSVEYDRYARPLADEILALRDAGHLRISHHLHLRAEICSETLVDELDEFDAGDRIGIVSLMDHTPGQRQYRDVTKLEDYLTIRHGLQGEALAAYLDRLRGLQARLGARHAAAAVAAAGRFGAALASHDDATAGQVAASMAQGVRMAEFPTTRDAAEACRAAGIAV